MNDVAKIDEGSAVPTQSRDESPLMLALRQGMPVETIREIKSMMEEERAWEAERAYNLAMSHVAEQLPTVLKSRQARDYKYESLEDVDRAVRKPLSKHGFLYRWGVDQQSADVVSVTCIISHVDGHTERTTLKAPVLKPIMSKQGNAVTNPVQALGSTISYLQRYSLRAALGVAAGYDDDAASVDQGRPSADGEAIEAMTQRIHACANIKALEAAYNKERQGLPAGPAYDALKRATNARKAVLLGGGDAD
jgi:hypothetical protein